MFETNTEYKLSMVMNLSEFSATPENSMNLLELFKEFGFLPGTFREVGSSTHPPSIRPKFSSINEEWEILIWSSKFVIVKRNVNEQPDKEEMEQFKKQSIKIIEAFTRKYEKKARRVALSTEGFFGAMSKEDLEANYKKFQLPINFYDENTPISWSNETIARTNVVVSGKQEVVNVVTHIGRVQGEIHHEESIAKFDRMNLDIDINTINENDTNRFDASNMKEFLEESILIRQKLISQVEMILNG